jgi:hypothetical protein
MRCTLCVAIVIAACGQIVPCRAAGDDPSPSVAARYREVQAGIAQRLRSRNPDDRIGALRDLASYPLAEVARTVLQTGQRDEHPDVRQAAYETLYHFRDSSEVCALLGSTLRRDSARSGIDAASAPFISVLAASQLPEAQRDLLEVLDRLLGTPRANMAVMCGIIDGFGQHGQLEDLRALQRLAQAKAFATEFGYRRAIVQAMTQVHLKQSLDVLVELLPACEGEIRADIVRHLTRVTGQDLQMNVAAWQAWWQQNKATFEYPDPAQLNPPRLADVRLGGQDDSSYYQIPIYGRRVVFILDTSSSMLDGPAGPGTRPTRMETAQRELLYAINGLKEDVYFNVVAYHSVVGVWQKQPVRATQAAKQSAARWIRALVPQNLTASYDALEATFAYPNLETIYFLSDGEPTAGKLIDPAQIIAAVTQANKARRVTIHTIGIQAQGAFGEFLRALAQQNYGVFRTVD